MTITRNRAALLLLAVLTVLTLGVSLLVTGLGSHRPARADTTPASSDTVSVSGNGTVEGVPDTLNADFNVAVRRSTVQAALDASNIVASKAIRALHADKVASKDIQSENVFVEPSYGRHGIDGYRAGQTLAVSLHPLKGVGKILGDVATSDGNSVRLNDVSYDISNNATLLAAAQGKAFAHAKTAAQKDASLAGRSLSRVISIKQTIHNTDTNSDSEYSSSALRGTAKLAAVPIEPGQQPVTVTVAVIWALQ